MTNQDRLDNLELDRLDNIAPFIISDSNGLGAQLEKRPLVTNSPTFLKRAATRSGFKGQSRCIVATAARNEE